MATGGRKLLDQDLLGACGLERGVALVGGQEGGSGLPLGDSLVQEK